MAATDRTQRSPEADTVAATCREAEFLRLVARADGDALAAAGTLAGACEAVGTPYAVRTVRTRDDVEAALASNAEATPLVLGAAVDGVAAVDDPVLSVTAYEAAVDLGANPDPLPALAGVVAAGALPGERGDRLLEDAGLDRREGVAIPTDDPADLAYSTLAHAAVSGNLEAARAALADLDETDGRELASWYALSAVRPADATDRAATAVERVLRPYAGGPFETVGGYADVLSALAHEAPGLGIAVVLGAGDRDAALSAWRDHGLAVHEAVRSASTARYAGLLVARVGGPVAPAARLLRDFRSPEPTVLAVGSGEAAVAALEPVGDAVETAAARVDGSALTAGRRGYAAFDPDKTDAFVNAFREAR